MSAPLKPKALPAPSGADVVLDVCSRLLTREALRLERKRALTAREIDLVVRIARAAAEVVAVQLNPLSPAQKKALQKLPDDQLRAEIERLEALEAAPETS